MTPTMEYTEAIQSENDIQKTVEIAGRQVPIMLIGDVRVIDVTDVARALEIPTHHIIRVVRLNEGLRGQKLGKRWLLDLDSFNIWIKVGTFQPIRERVQRAIERELPA